MVATEIHASCATAFYNEVAAAADKNFCATCDATKNRELKPILNQAFGPCVCKATFYEDATGACVACGTGVATCNATAALTCTVATEKVAG